MGAPNLVLFEDAAGPYTLADLSRAVKTWTTDPAQQAAVIEAYLAGHGKFVPPRLRPGSGGLTG